MKQKNIRMDVAYCIELNAIVDIQRACLEFIEQDVYEKFNFLCSDPLCHNTNVRVIAVNHNKLPEEGDKVIKSPHYRVLDEHLPTCEWIEFDSIKNCDQKIPNSQEHSFDDLKDTIQITNFILQETNSTKNDNSEDIVKELNNIRRIFSLEERLEARKEYAQRVGSTTRSFEALISCYEGLKINKELKKELTISGEGTFSFQSLFKHVSNGPRESFTVFYGGAYLYKRYGDGFSLSFFDKFDGKNISFYLSKDDIQSFCLAKRLQKIVDTLEKEKERKPYVTVYWIGSLELGKNGVYNAKFISPNQVAMRLVYPKK